MLRTSPVLRDRQVALCETFGSALDPIQRAPAAGSDATLAAQYAVMMGSPAFTELDRIVSPVTRPVHLVDSAGLNREVDYTHTTHTIRTPVTVALAPGAAGPAALRPLADINDDLLFEMHNARKRGELGRAWTDRPNLAPNASRAERDAHPFKMAIFALSWEWDEWVNVAEHHARSAAINADVGAGTTADGFAPNYPVGGGGFYSFETYLAANLAGHTVAYDPTATSPRWEGKAAVAKIRGSAKIALNITPTELTAWAAGNRKSHIKKSNPFSKLKP